MNNISFRAGIPALLFTVAATTAALPQAAPQPTAPAAGTEGAAAVAFPMTLGDMMNTLVQPRHVKLGLAGQARNWALAEYALVELRQTFAGIVKAEPHFRGLPIGELVDAAVSGPMNAVETAIREQNAKKFAASYAQLTAGCNACHQAAFHPFVVIKAPAVSAFPDQDFNPRP
jgi:hypothetical protein